MALFDPSRLYTQLQNTGLANKDQPLFQLINQMIGAMAAINKIQNAGSSSGGGSSTTTIIQQTIQQLFADSSGGSDGDIGPPGINGIPGEDGANGMVPYFIAPTEEFTVPEFKQALFAMNIDNEGSLVVDGFLIEVDGSSEDSDCCDRAFPIIYPDSYESSENGYPPGNPDAALKGGINAFVGTNSFANNPVDLLVGQLKFPATQNSSANANTLDDYEEGDWTPILTFGGASVGITYSTNAGKYVKIGRYVACVGLLALTAKGSSVGNAVVTGFPFVNGTGNPFQTASKAGYTGFTAGVDQVGLQSVTASATAFVVKSVAGTNTLTTDVDFGATSTIIMYYCFMVD